MSDIESKFFFLKGIEHFNNKDFLLAENEFEKALELSPNRISILENLAKVYFINKSYNKSEKLLNQLIDLKKDSEEIFNLKFNVLKKLEKFKELKLHIDENLNTKNLNTEKLNLKYKIIKNFIYPNFFENQKELDLTRNEFKSSINDLECTNDIKLSVEKDAIDPPIFNISYDQYENLELNKKIVNLYRKFYPQLNQDLSHEKKNKKIKIGFFSEFFSNHTIGKLYKGIIFKLDNSKFEVYVFHSENTKKSPIFEEFLSAEIDLNIKNIILPKNFDKKIEIINKENLDIAFFPEIGMSTEFYFLSYVRLAKKQITSWGHPITSGNNSIDYFLSSKLLETDNAQKKFSEKLILFEHLPMYFYKPKINKTLSKEEMIKRNIYFCSQTLIKVHPNFDEIINKILTKDKKAKIFFIQDKSKIISKKLFERFKKNIPLRYESINFINQLRVEDYINFCGSASVLLDTLYFGAGNSFHESMFYGTPTITMPTKHLKSRIVVGAYKQMKIENPPVVGEIDEYVDRAVEIANLNEKNMIDVKNYYSKNANLYLYENINIIKNLEKFFINISSS